MRVIIHVVLAVSMAAAFAGYAAANELDDLKADLAGANDQARCLARQLLPRYGVEALEGLVPLLSHPDANVRWAAEKVVEDIANQAGGPGRLEDRLEVMAVLYDLIDPAASADLTIKAMEFLPLVAPEGVSVQPVADLLGHAELREKARACLQHIGTAEACKALVAALPKADPVFACALLDAIAHCEDPASVPVVLETAKTSGDASVRAAALRALAWTGDPSLVSVFQGTRARAPEAAKLETNEALILLAEAMAKRGGNWEVAMALYKDLLATSPYGIQKSAALMGLGRFGDASVVSTIADGVKGGDPRLQAAAVFALEGLHGSEAAEAIRDAYPSFEPDIQVRLVQMFGRRGDAQFFPILEVEAKSENPALRKATLRALAGSSFSGALPILVDIAQTGTEEERKIAMDAATRIAGSLGTSGDVAGAGKAYLGLFNLAKDDALRVTALQGLARYPVAEAYDVVLGALKSEPLKAAASGALPGLFGAVAGAGQEDKALNLFELVTKTDPSPGTLLSMASQLQGVKTKLDTTWLLGVVQSWHVIGPFTWKTDADWKTPFVGEPAIDLAKTYPDGKEQRGWKACKAGNAVGLVNLAGEIAQQDGCFGYAYTEIEVDEAMPAQIRIGSDDGNAVWVNGKQIWENRVDRGTAMDQDIADCDLVKGVNRILVKISQGAGGWCFQLRITRRDGTAAPFRMHDPAKK